MTLLLVAQVGVGMVVNLYVTIPARHPGADPANYFSGSARSVGWALGSAPAALAVHAGLGVALVLGGIAVAIGAWRCASRTVGALTVLAAGLIIGAAFNGASFLDFNHDISSLIMALLALAALLCYVTALFVLPTQVRGADSEKRHDAPDTQTR